MSADAEILDFLAGDSRSGPELKSQNPQSQKTPYSFSWYMERIWENWVISSQLVMASVLSQLFGLGLPVFYLVIFDRVFSRNNLATLDVMGTAIVATLFFDLIVKMLRSYLMSHQMQRLDIFASQCMLEQLQQIRATETIKSLSQTLSEKFPELLRFNRVVLSTLLISSLDVFFSFIIMLILFLLNPLLAGVSLLPIVPIIMFTLWHTPIARRQGVAASNEQRRCQFHMTELMNSWETLLSLNATHFRTSLLGQKVSQFIQNSFSSRLNQLGSGSIYSFFINLGSILTLYVGAHLVIEAKITFGAYLAINMISRNVMGTLKALLTSLMEFQEALGGMHQFRKTFEKNISLSSEIDSLMKAKPLCLTNIKGNLKVDHISFRYDATEPWIFRDLSMEVKPGERLVITGKSGSGKTTLTRLLQGLYEPSSGFITLDTYNLHDLDPENLRDHVGMALQKPAIFTGTIRENIAVGKPQATTQEIIDAAHLAELDDVLHNNEKGLDGIVKPFGGNLSGGEIQRIALARVILRKPDILILDEALNALSPVTRIQIINNIHRNFKQSTCIFVTSFLPLHQVADRIIVMEKGNIVEEGHFKTLIENKSHYFNLYNPAGTPA